MSIVRELVARADSWVNAMTGLGTLRDKLMHAQVMAGAKLQDPQLEALFNDDDVARRIVSKLPREATRRGFYLELEGDEEEEAPADVDREMQVAFSKLEAMPKLRDGWIWARLYGGGSGVFVGADDGQLVDQPLNEAAIRTIKFLNVLKRPQLSIHSRYADLREPKYGEPEIYSISQGSGFLAPQQGLLVHESRLILFDGALTAQMAIESPTGFDDSVLQAAYAALQQTATAWQSVAHLMTDASQGVLKIANLVDLVAAGGQETLRSRIQLMDLARSVCRSILVDAEKESFERVSTSFAGLPEVLDKLMMRMSAASDGMPVTLLYGRSPAGMNATGESDIRGWYDTVVEAQSDELKPRLERLLTLMFLAKDSPTRGTLPEQWCIEFNPLWQPTDKEVAETKKVIADTYVALVTGNVMTDAEAGLALAPDFPSIDVEARTKLAEADQAEGARPREVNTPPPPELPPDAGPDAEGDSEGTGPKARGDSGRQDAQARVPAGSPRGGQWTSGGGASGGKAEALAAIRGSLASGKNAAVVALQQKLVQRYGMPIQKAALAYERDIKLQLKAAKAQRASETAEKRAAKGAVDEALGKSLGAMRGAIKAKGEAEAKKAADAAGKKAAKAAKAKATREANKVKKLAEANEKRAAEAKAKKEVEAEAKASGTPDASATIASAMAANEGSLLAGMAATTGMVKGYLGVTQRPAKHYGISDQDLNSQKQGWGGYNDKGRIVLDSAQAQRLRSPPKKTVAEAEDAERGLVAQRNKVSAAMRQPGISKEESARLQKESSRLQDQIHGTQVAANEARLHQRASLILVHEELHSFGPMHNRGRYGESLYKGEGRTAEEVTTEVLARDIVHGSKMAPHQSGAYEHQIEGVLDAVWSASNPKARMGREERFAIVVKASKDYKRTKESESLMDTLHEHIVKHAPSLDSAKLRQQLAKVKEP
jgi:phage-related protein (TIGR01555 family)